MNTYENKVWSEGTPSNGDRVLYIDSAGGKLETYYSDNSEPIRIISTGAMQRRFTIPEEVFISSDPAATVIKSRLLNASYADLDFQDTIDGVTYICSVLKTGGVITDEAARVAELLQDGTQEEKI